jgi:hypothetical protein
VNDIEELKREGLSIQAISRLTGFDRKRSEIPAEAGRNAGPRTASSATEQAGGVQALHSKNA